MSCTLSARERSGCARLEDARSSVEMAALQAANGVDNHPGCPSDLQNSLEQGSKRPERKVEEDELVVPDDEADASGILGQ